MNSAQLNWWINQCAIGYQVRYRVVGTTPWTIKNINSNTSFLELKALKRGTSYEWQVRSKCTANPVEVFSAFTSPLVFTTLSGSGRSIASNASVPANEVSEDLNKQFLYPNPASEFVYLNFNSAKEGLVNIQIVNSIGQLVKQHPVNTIKGHNQFKIQVADIRPGMYILRINKGDLNLTKKFVIAR